VKVAGVAIAIGSLGFAPAATPQGLLSSDLSRLRSIGGVAVSPDGNRVAYSVVMRDRPGRPYGQLWIMDLSNQKSLRIGGDKDGGGGAVWSSDGKWIAFSGHPGRQGWTFHRATGRIGGDVFGRGAWNKQSASGHGKRDLLVSRQ